MKKLRFEKQLRQHQQTFASIRPQIRFAEVTSPDGQTPSIVKVTGYPIVWNAVSSSRGGYKVKLAPGSAYFRPPTMALYNHDTSNLLGTTANGSLRILESDDTGIPIEILLPATTLAKDVTALLTGFPDKEIGAYVGGMSFSMEYGIEDADEGDDEDEKGDILVTAKRYTVGEVTITPCPAFEQTSIGLAQDDEEDDEEYSRRIAAKLKLRAMRLNSLTF